MVRLIRVCALCVFAGARVAWGQFADATRPNTRGFFMRLSGAATSFRGDSLSRGTETGLGTGLGIGFGFGDQFSLVFDGGSAFYRRGQVDKYHVDGFDFGARIHFPRRDSRIVPYADLFVSEMFLRKDSVDASALPVGKSLASKTDIDCSCFTIGGGVLVHLTSKWAVDVMAHRSDGSFKTVAAGSPIQKPNLSLPSYTWRLNVGLAWYPDTTRFPTHGRAGGGVNDLR